VRGVGCNREGVKKESQKSVLKSPHYWSLDLGGRSEVVRHDELGGGGGRTWSENQGRISIAPRPRLAVGVGLRLMSKGGGGGGGGFEGHNTGTLGCQNGVGSPLSNFGSLTDYLESFKGK